MVSVLKVAFKQVNQSEVIILSHTSIASFLYYAKTPNSELSLAEEVALVSLP